MDSSQSVLDSLGILRQGKGVQRGSVLAGFFAGVLATAAVFSLFGDARDGEAHAATALDRPAFYGALDTMLHRYVEPVDRGALLSRGLKHMVAGLDPHSHYLTADERRTIAHRAAGGQTGLSVVMHPGDRPEQRSLEIVGVQSGSPADDAGLHPGDHILRIRDREVAFLLSQAEAEGLLLGAKGDNVPLLVQRQGEPSPRMIVLTLAAGSARPVDGRLLDHGAHKVAVVEIRAFRRGTGAKTKQVLDKLTRAAGAEGLAGIVLDVRDNPGGEVDEALIVADAFIDSGVLTRTRGRGGRILREERAHASDTDKTTPVVVLQDRHTASAAELLSVALREHKRARVIGERSYGKGTVQEVIGLEDGSVLTLTIARYFSPRDRMIDGTGVAPHVRVTSVEGEPGLQAALDALPSG